METGDDQEQEEALENLLIEFNVVSEQVSVIHTNTSWRCSIRYNIQSP